MRRNCFSLTDIPVGFDVLYSMKAIACYLNNVYNFLFCIQPILQKFSDQGGEKTHPLEIYFVNPAKLISVSPLIVEVYSTA